MATKNPKAAIEAAAAAPDSNVEQSAEVDTQQQDDAQAEQASAKAGAAPETAAASAEEQGEDVERRDVRVLAPVTISGVSYSPNDVIEGLPLALIEAYAGSIDDHPDAVDYAHSIGAPVKQFEPLVE